MEQRISFVIHVTDYGQGRPIRGLIEHVSTAASARFEDLEQANAFIRTWLLLQTGPADPAALERVREPAFSILSFLRRQPRLPEHTPAPVAPPDIEQPAIEPGSLTPPAEQPSPEVPAGAEVGERAGETAGTAALPPPDSDSAVSDRAVISTVTAPGGRIGRLAGAIPRRLGAAPMTSTTGAPLDQALTTMLDILGGYLPPLALPLPGASISVASVRERSVGIGYQRGIDVRGAFAVADLKGLRLDAVVRFQLWAANPGQLDTALNGLNTRLLADRNILWTAGVLRMALDATAVTEFVSSVDGWRGLADYRVLFEYHYSDSDGAESLIARIPIEADQEILNSPERETSLVTDEMARWDDQSAPALVLRGRLRIGSLSALAFVPGAAPSGAVTITRTYDGATGAPSLHGTLAEFLAALGNPAGPERNAQVSFATLSDFLAALGAGTPDIVLGDWNLDGVLDSYELKVLPFDPPIQLPSVSDRLEIRYANAPFDQVGVVYLRAQRR